MNTGRKLNTKIITTRGNEPLIELPLHGERAEIFCSYESGGEFATYKTITYDDLKFISSTGKLNGRYISMGIAKGFGTLFRFVQNGIQIKITDGNGNPGGGNLDVFVKVYYN